MSEQFYNYLANKVVAYFTNATIERGDRFEIRFDKEEEVRNLYSEILKVGNTSEFSYIAEPGEEAYNTYTFNVRDLKVIVATTLDGTEPAYLTNLRNNVGKTGDIKFEDKAILFIHNDNLDSILTGAISFRKEGMPFHVGSIINDIKEEVQSSNLTLAEKRIIEYELKKFNKIDEDGLSLLQFEELLEIINKGTVEKQDYKKLRLFYDGQLYRYYGKELDERINDNASIFEKIDNIHKYNADVVASLDKFLDDEGKEILKNPLYWKDTEYKTVKSSIDAKSEDKEIQFIGYDLQDIREENFWDRSEKESAASRRKRKIIIFNPDRWEQLSFYIKFDERLSSKDLKIVEGNEVKASTSGKRIMVEINHEVGKVSFCKIQLKADVNYEFFIVILDISNKLFIDSELQTGFTICSDKMFKGNIITLCTQSEALELNNSESNIEEVEIVQQHQEFVIDVSTRYRIINKVRLDESIDRVYIYLKLGELCIPLAIRDEANLPTRISGYNVWVKKREENKSFIYKEDRLIQGNNIYYAVEKFRDNLELETKIINSGYMYFRKIGNNLEGVEIDIPSNIKEAYAMLIEYYRVNNTLPSLASYSKELCQYVMKYVLAYLEALEQLKDQDYVTSKHKDLARIGMIKVQEEEQIWLTPMHPINLIYQINLKEEMKTERLHESIGRRLDSLYLLPYLSEEKDLYKPIEQNHSIEWKYYVKNNSLKHKSTRKFISKLVQDKLEEFVDNFEYLFQFSPNTPIILNLINTGDCKEILQGIINFCISQLKEKGKQLRQIIVNIYSDEVENIFEQLSYYDTLVDIETNLDLSFEAKRLGREYSNEDILDICREKILFYKRSLLDEEYQYCHISFYEMMPNIEERDSKQKDMITGVSLKGIVSGVPSRFINDSYRTGFGTKYMDMDQENLLLRISCELNALYKATQAEGILTKNECRTTTLSSYDKKQLDKIYNSSSWVTFIEPKVDLKFFKNNKENNDLLIIHYSDQYTSTSGYDAITVTRKSEQYKLIISETLKDNHVDVSQDNIISVIDCFNAINGEWLLKIISRKSQFPREKISIISTIKLSLAYFYHPDIIWVPISLEEVLRVSKGAGLSAVDGLFSVKNLKGEGAYSDDLLLIGVEQRDDQVKIHFYPIEVKIGKNSSTALNKAKKQSYKTRNYIDKHLIELISDKDDRKFSKKMYRNFMMQLVIISAEKMKLYDVWEEQNWDSIINSEVRTKLLNDEYTISNELDSIIGRGAIISFKEGTIYSKSEFIEVSQEEIEEQYKLHESSIDNRLLVVTFSEKLGYQYIIEDIEKIKNDIQSDHTDIQKSKLLSSLYKQKGIKVENNTKTERVNDQKNQEEIDINYINDKENIVKQSISKDYNIIVGKEINGTEIVLYDPKRSGNPLSNMNVMITGSSGKGKTQLLKSMIVQQRRKGTNLLIFDFKNDFSDQEFIEMANVKCINLEFDGLPYNPLIPPIKTNGGKKFMNIGEQILAIAGVIKQVYKLGVQQEVALKNAFRDIYSNVGLSARLSEVQDMESIVYPIIDDVAEILAEQDEKAYSRLDTLFNYGLFRTDTRNISLTDLLNDSYVFSLNSISNDEVKNAIAKIIVVSTHQYLNTLPHAPNDIKNIFVFDEAHRFLGEPSLEKLARECRAYGMAVWLSSQYPGDYPEEISGCLETKIIHGNGDDEDKIKQIKKLINYDGESENLSKLGMFQSIFNNTHYNKKFIYTLAFPQLILLKELEEKGEILTNQIESIHESRREEVISHLLKLKLIKINNDKLSING